MRFAVPVALLIALLVLFHAGLQRDPREVPSPLIGKPAPAFALPGMGGTPPLLKPADLAGRPVMVNFFASWCTACREEHPLFMQLAGQGVEIIGIDYKDVEAEGRAWLDRHGNPYRTVVLDAQGAAGLDWGVYGVPETYVLGADGTILYKHIGAVTEAAWREKIAPLMGVKS